MLAKAAGAEPSGRIRDQKLHAAVARRTFGNQNQKNTSVPERLEIKMPKRHHVRTAFGCWTVILRGRRNGFCTLPKASKTWGFRSSCKNRVAGAEKETSPSEMLGGQGAVFLRGVAFWSIRSSGLLRWFCVTGTALRMTWLHFFVAGARYFRQMGWKNRKMLWHEAASSALNFRSVAELLRFVVVNFKNWGSLAELLCFGAVRFHFLRKSCKTASFRTCQLPLLKEVLQNCFLVFRQTDR